VKTTVRDATVVGQFFRRSAEDREVDACESP